MRAERDDRGVCSSGGALFVQHFLGPKRLISVRCLDRRRPDAARGQEAVEQELGGDARGGSSARRCTSGHRNSPANEHTIANLLSERKGVARKWGAAWVWEGNNVASACRMADLGAWGLRLQLYRPRDVS